MYNNDRKQEFIGKEFEIRELESLKKRYNWVFNTTEKYESKYKKDVADFSYEEILEMYKDIKVGLSTLLDLHGVLKKYSFSFVGINSQYLLFTHTELKKHFINEKRVLLSQKNVIDFTDILLNPMDKFCVYSLFCGVKGPEYCEINYSSMDGANDEEKTIWLANMDDGRNINLKGRKFFADEKLYSFAKEASEAVYMLQLTKNGVYKKVLLEQGTKKILKNPFSPLEKNPSDGRALQRIQKSILPMLDIKGVVTPIDFYWSGLIFSIQKKALFEKGAITNTIDDYLDFLNEDGCDDIQEQYNIDLNTRRLKAKLERYL